MYDIHDSASGSFSSLDSNSINVAKITPNAATSNSKTFDRKQVASHQTQQVDYQLHPDWTFDEIKARYSHIEQVRKDFKQYSDNPEFRKYITFCNAGRSNNNAWLLLKTNFERFAHKPAIMWLNSKAQVQTQYTFRELGQHILKVSYYLHQFKTQHKLQENDRVVLCFSPCIEFFVVFWACISVQLCPVPVCPVDPWKANSSVHQKLQYIINDCQAKLILTDDTYMSLLETVNMMDQQKDGLDLLSAGIMSTSQLCRTPFDSSYTFDDSLHDRSGIQLAFLQYSSGSTSAAKGIMVAHVNLVQNARLCSDLTRSNYSFDIYRTSCTVNWAPVHHDLALIGFSITPLLFGMTNVFFSPLDFLMDPILWFRIGKMLMQQYSFSHISTGCPPFALELCVKQFNKLTVAEQQHFDLSWMYSLILGAEPIQLSTLRKFTSTFSNSGFDDKCLMPSYGLAESVLFVNGKKDNQYPIHCICVSLTKLAQNKLEQVDTKAHDENDTKQLVSCGEIRNPTIASNQNHQAQEQTRAYWSTFDNDVIVIIVDPHTRVEIQSGCIGEIWVHSRSVAIGYWNNPDATNATFLGKVVSDNQKIKPLTFLRTGDLGAILDNQLYITGRLKEMIIKNGQNFYPQDFECLVNDMNVEAVRQGCVVSFHVTDMRANQDELVCLIELRDKQTRKAQQSMIVSKMKQLLQSHFSQLMKMFKYLPKSVQQVVIRRVASHFKQTAKSKAYTEDELREIEQSIQRQMMTIYQFKFNVVLFVKPKTLLKTTSGKLQRGETKMAFIKGQLDDKMIVNKVPKHKVYHQIESKPAQNGVIACTPSEPSTPVSEASISNQASVQGTDAIEAARPKLTREQVQNTVLDVISSELAIDPSAIKLMSESFEFDHETNLEEFGLDSLKALKIAGMISNQLQLRIPISPHMLLKNGTLQGLCDVAMKLDQMEPIQASANRMKTHINGHVNANGTANGTAHHSMNGTSSSSVDVNYKSDQNGMQTNQLTSAPSSSNAHVLAIGTQVPGGGSPQEAIMDYMIRQMELPENKAKLFQKIGQASGVSRRYSVLPSIQSIYFGKKGRDQNECIETRNEIFKVEAPKLAAQAATKALKNWQGSRDQITHVLSICCTGILVPGIEFYLMQELGLPLSCQRLSINFMGCFGAISGMKTAAAFARENPNNRVLMVCVELCSLHMQLDDRVDNMVGASLFADGAGAMIIGCEPQTSLGEQSLYEIHKAHSLIIPNTLPMMDWILTNSGMSIGLGKEIPDAIYENVDQFVYQLLDKTEAFNVPFQQMRWAIHPGGPMIIESICHRLGINSEKDIHAVWDVLQNYGNMSSATLIFVLQEMIKYKKPHKTFVPSLAFGPGLNIEGLLLSQ